MTRQHSRTWLHAALAILSLVGGSAHAATPRGKPIELDPQPAEILWATACNTYPQAIQAYRSLGSGGGIIAEVQCSPHADYQGQPVSLAVECTQQANDTQWQCRKAIPTIDLKIRDQVVRIRYTFTSAAEVSDLIKYLLTAPSVGRVAVDPGWLATDIYIHGPGDHLLVSASNRLINVAREQRQGVTHFRATGIDVCESDVCFPLTDAGSKK